MRPLFTIHAGEYLVGSHIEQRFPKLNIWIPAKDTGIDLLITDASASRAVSLQVKFSKDFNPTHHTPLLQRKLAAAGWWTHQDKKIENSNADFWVFVLPSFTERRTNFIIIEPTEFLRRLRHSRQVGEKTALVLVGNDIGTLLGNARIEQVREGDGGLRQLSKSRARFHPIP